MKTVRTKLRKAKRSEAAIAADLQAIRSRLARTRARLHGAKARLARTRREQSKLAALLAASQRRLREREMALARRMAANYRQGPVRYASVILGSRSMGDFVTRAHFVRSILRYDARLIAQIKADREEVLRWKAQVDRKAGQVEGLKRELGARQADEAADVVRQRTVLAEARERRAQLEDALDTLQHDSARIATRIRALEETPVGRARRLIPFTGSFLRPVAGAITSGFGMRFHPILHRHRLHAGVDFAAAAGTPIYAVAGGVVVFAGSMRGYGNVVVIDHGGGISTLYAHCSVLLISESASVKQGQPIARVGSTGMSTGPHLHFEVRKNGTPVNPLGAL
jgi:murein DD-endopeptidase MepM/ murein hydrolase activator NlpD